MATPFEQRVYSIVKKVPAGKVTTYGAIARALGTNGYRAVGLALSKNSSHLETPCHRVVGADGSLKSWAWGVDGKIAALKAEGVTVENGKVADFSRVALLDLPSVV
jgi:methylated-DNA-[protein]-cysteine S-methyltransferase